MAEEAQNLWIDGFNPSIYKQLVNCFEIEKYKTEVTLNQSERMRLDLKKQDNSDVVEIMVNCSCWKDIEDCNVKEYVKSHLGDVLGSTTAHNVNLCLRITKEHYQQGGKEYLKKVAYLHDYILSAPFYKYLHALQSGTTSSLYPKVMSFYSHEPIYIIPKSSSISVIFSINEEDDTDKALIPIFLLELSEAKRTVAGSPSVSFSREEPKDIQGIAKEKPTVGYIIFSFNEEHVAGDRAEKAANLLCSFRFYLDYHVKLCKTYLHGRMRIRAESWREALRKAHYPEEDVQKTTISGKTFTSSFFVYSTKRIHDILFL